MPTTFTHPDLAAAAVVDSLRAAGFEVDPPRSVTRVALDTFDGRLHEAGLRLEHRRGAEVALVLSDRSGAPPAQLVGATAPVWPGGLPAGPLRARLAAVTGERALLPQLTVASEVHVAGRHDRRGKAVVHAELHEAVRVDGHGVEGWYLELIGVVGHDVDEERIVARLEALGFSPEGDDLASVLAVRTGHVLTGRSSSPTVPLAANESALVAFRRVLANLADTIDANRQGTIDDIDVEFLHELRVAVRRSRAVLAEGKGVLPPDIRDRFREAFGWLGQRTGPARDLDVYVLGWDSYVAPLGLPDDSSLHRVKREIDIRRASAHADLASLLASDETTRRLDDWRLWLADPGADPGGGQRIGPVVARRVARAQKRVLEGGRAITAASPPERLHDLRKEAKKLRYLLECFGSLFPSKPRKAFVTQLKDLQDNLGAHQDAEVHLAQLRDLAYDLHARSIVDTDALLAMGRLSDHLERRRAEERAAFTERFGGYDTKANRKALARLLAGVSDG